ncbi:MAG: hypothetical protein KGJ80_16730 [Chloroflexota bacterium]|nr:hypothetical protein [Chloroflexota bacterium]
MTANARIGAPLDAKTRLRQYWLLVVRFARRYGVAVLALAASALIGWLVANGVSDYTKGGWEIHLIERGIGLNLHFHHWYYGIPLYLLAIALIEWHATTSIFVFGLGQTLAAHSFINEGGIPSIIEGGATWRISPEIYFPIITGLALLYAFFIIRREEWLARAKEREEISMSYLCPNGRMEQVLARLDQWAANYLEHKKSHIDPDTHIEYGEWRALDREFDGEWQLHYVASPFDEQLHLLDIRIEHIPLQGRAGKIDDWMQELDAALQPHIQPAIGGARAAVKAFAASGRSAG